MKFRANPSQNICEVQMKDESSERLPLPSESLFPLFSPETNGRNTQEINSDFFNFIKTQYLTQNEHLYRNLRQNNGFQRSNDNNSDTHHEEEHAMRMEILKVELETAKIKKEIAEINKEILLEQLNK